jgi:hypothetical protein
MFRQSVLCLAGQTPTPQAQTDAITSLRLAARLEPLTARADPAPDAVEAFRSASGASLSTNSPRVKAALRSLGGQWPRFVPFELLRADAERAIEAAEDATTVDADRQLVPAFLLQCDQSNLLDLRTHEPRFATTPTERPVASPLARLQAERGSQVTNLLHRIVELDDLQRRVLRLLDGHRDRAALLDGLQDGAKDAVLQATSWTASERLEDTGAQPVGPHSLDATLDRLSDACLLVS